MVAVTSILDIVENCRQMRPQLRLRYGFGYLENYDVAGAIAVADRNLKL